MRKEHLGPKQQLSEKADNRLIQKSDQSAQNIPRPVTITRWNAHSQEKIEGLNTVRAFYKRDNFSKLEVTSMHSIKLAMKRLTSIGQQWLQRLRHAVMASNGPLRLLLRETHLLQYQKSPLSMLSGGMLRGWSHWQWADGCGHVAVHARHLHNCGPT